MCKEGTCKCKEICAKMQKVGLREGLTQLLSIKPDNTPRDATKILCSIQNILENYDCIVCDVLINRVKYLKEQMEKNDSCFCSSGCLAEILILSKEIEKFLENT